MNLIQEDSEEVKCFTDMLKVAEWLGISIADYNWHLSGIELNQSLRGLEDPCWFTGTEFSEYVGVHRPQFVWAVLSAFPPASKPFLSNLPYADGNSSIWKATPRKQLESSLFEIVSWDSSATLYIGLPDALGQNLLKKAPGIRILGE